MSNKHISIYGDESVNNNIACYGICVFPADLIKAAESIINSIKAEFKVPLDYFLHCNILLNYHEIQKLDFDINLKDAENLYRKIANKFKTVDMLCCYVDKRDIKKDKEIIDWGSGAKTEIYFGDKELIHQCKNGSMIDIVRSKQESEYTFYPDPDKDSVMRWNNKKKAKVSNQNYNIIVSADTIKYESHPDQMIRAKQNNIVGEKPSLIQIADFLVYSFAKAKTVQRYKNKEFFIEMIGILNPVSRRISFEEGYNLNP
jgi:hypothetical protein